MHIDPYKIFYWDAVRAFLSSIKTTFLVHLVLLSQSPFVATSTGALFLYHN